MNDKFNTTEHLRRLVVVILLCVSGLSLLSCVEGTSSETAPQSDPGIVTGIDSDTTPPIISIEAPLDNSVIMGTVTITAQASDNEGVTGIKFLLDDSDLGEEITGAPYNLIWDTASITNGTHKLTALARDASGNTTSTSITVTVNNTIFDLEAPTTPTDLTATPVSMSQINLSWTAATDNIGVSGYKVYRSDSFVSTVTTTSFSDSDLAAGAQYTYYITALDSAGNESLPSPTVIASTVAPDSTPPTVEFSYPVNADIVSGSVLLTVTASDDVGVAGVQFKLDNTNLGSEVTTAPYSFSWNTTTASNTQHSLVAVARDAAGNVASANIIVTVDNQITDTDPPTAPTNLTAIAVSASQIALSWTAATDNVGVSQYEVYRDGLPVAFTTATTYSDTDLTSSTVYTYTVVAHDAAGNPSQPSNNASTTTTSSGTTYTTNFDLTENPISENGAWSNIGLDWTKVVTNDGIAYGTHHATGYNDSYAILSGFAADQSVEGTIFITGSFTHNQEVELLLRWSQSAHVAHGYEILWQANNSYAEIVRWNGALSDFTILHRLNFPRAPVTGDVMKAQIVGSLITVYLNETLVGSFTDSTWTTGNPGIGFYSDDPTGGQNSRFGFTSFTATDL